MVGRYSRVRTLSVHEQSAHLRQLYPNFDTQIRAGLLTSRGLLRPALLTAAYEVRIEYRAGSWPRVFVVEPELTARSESEPVPHVYGQNEPCLFVPGGWQGDRIIALTIIPGLSWWLMFYESWMVTGEWLGGGVHPSSRKRPIQERPSTHRGRQE